MTAYVDDIVRSELPLLNLDEAYEAKTVLSENIKKELTEGMNQFGLKISKALITGDALCGRCCGLQPLCRHPP